MRAKWPFSWIASCTVHEKLLYTADIVRKAIFQKLPTKHLCPIVMELGFHATSCCVLFFCVESGVFKGRVT